MPANNAVELSISRHLCNNENAPELCTGRNAPLGAVVLCGGAWLMPMLITVVGSPLKTPARSHAICISPSVRPLVRRNFCFCTIELRVTFGFCKNDTAALIWNYKGNLFGNVAVRQTRNNNQFISWMQRLNSIPPHMLHRTLSNNLITFHTHILFTYGCVHWWWKRRRLWRLLVNLNAGRIARVRIIVLLHFNING